MRLLVAVKSCVRDALRGDEDCVRQSWGKYLPENVDLRFFVGLPNFDDHFRAKDDEIILDCPDDYDSLPKKTWAILDFLTMTDYDFCFLCDNDTFVHVPKFMKCGFENYDFAGRFGHMPPLGEKFNYKDPRGVYNDIYGWPSGGVGYFVSRKAAELAIREEPKTWAEDQSIGQALGGHIKSGEIKAVDLPNFEGNVSWHFPRREYNNVVFNPTLGWHEKMIKQFGGVL